MNNICDRLFKFLLFDRFIKYGFLLTALQIFSGILGYIYQILVGRMLLPTDYALFSAVLALFMFISAPISAFSMLIVKKVSTLKAKQRIHHIEYIYWYLIKYSIAISLFLLTFLMLCNEFLTTYLKAPNKVIGIFFSLIVVLSIFSAINLSFYQGLQKFLSLGLLGVILVALKILLSIFLIFNGNGVNGALMGIIISMFIVYIIGAIPFIRKFSFNNYSYNIKLNFELIKEILPILIATISLGAITQLDMVFVNWFFNPADAGSYAAASVLGKAVLYLPGGLVIALYPMVAEGHAKGTQTLPLLIKAGLITLFCCGIISLIYWNFNTEIIMFFFGENYLAAANILKWYGLAILPISLVIITEHFLIAKGKIIFSWLFLIMTPLQFLAINIWHTELWMILAIMCISGLFILIVGFTIILKNYNCEKNF